jgi:hypothetical protein
MIARAGAFDGRQLRGFRTLVRQTAAEEGSMAEIVPHHPSAGAGPAASGGRAADALRRILGRRPATVFRRLVAGLAIFGVIYYGLIGAVLMHRIDADPEFMPPRPVEGGSRAVAMAAALVEREVETHRWSVNDPRFFPTAFLDNMPNFQKGMMRAISRFSIEMMDKVGRTRGTAELDSDLERAVGLLQFPGDVWIFDFEKSLLPVVPADAQYRAGRRALEAYNQRLAAGGAVFEVRADVLALTLNRLAADMNARAGLLDRHVQRSRRTIDFMADDIFYFNKGMLYAYYLLLRELGQDFDYVISQSGVYSVWNQAMDSLRRASQLQPLIVLNAPGDDSIFANHLFLQGFYMKRAIMQIDEVVRVLTVRG